LKKYLRNKVLLPLLSILRQGMSVEKMSLTLALGISFGIMPFLGVSTYLLALLAFIFRLNIPAIQFVNYAVYVVQVVLFVPFLKLGQWIFYPNESGLQYNNILSQYQSDFVGTLKTFWHLSLGAIIVWAIIAIPMGLGIYYFSQPYLTKKKLKLMPVLA
jgi:uncharacterized protein (DUF2062 family)